MGKIVQNRFTKLYEEQDTGRVYRRITAGMGWPYMERPGFIVVIGEENERDHSLIGSPRHLRVLDEAESHDLEVLYRSAGKFADDYGVDAIRCDCKDPSQLMWRKIPRADEVPVRTLSTPYWEKLSLRFVAQAIQKHTKLQKSLHFGEKSKLPGCLDEISTEQIEELQLTRYPAITALAIALAELELGSYITGGAGFRPRRKRYYSERPRGY